MGRSIIAIIAGLAAALALTVGAAFLGHLLFPAAGNPALAAMAAGDMAGAVVGGWLATRIAASGEGWPPLTVGAVMALGSANFVLAIPHPAWFVAMVLVGPVPLAWAGHRLHVRRAG